MRHTTAFLKLAHAALLLCVCTLQLWAQGAAQAPSERSPQPAKDGLAGLQQRITAILARPGLQRAFWGVEIEDLDSGQILYWRDADRLFEPASNAKLFTTAAALALLGSGYRVQTTVESVSAPDNQGRLAGDLVLVGRGDANLSGRALPFNTKTERPFPPTRVIDELADQLVARGVKSIEGDIVGDDSYFADEPYAAGWSQEDVTSLWGAPVSALAVNDNVVYLDILPAPRPGERALFSLSPFADYYRIDNHVLTTAAGTAHRISIQQRAGSHHIELRGSIAVDDPGYGEALAVDDPANWSALLLREALIRRGVTIYGQARADHQELAAPNSKAAAGNAAAAGSQPNARVVLAEHLSLPLAADIRVTNKVSQNLHAEMMLRLLGRERGSAGSLDGGLAVLRQFAALAGIAPDEYALYDGCGLSRHDLVSPQAIVKLLIYAAHQPWGPDFIESLPVAGVDGTLTSRLQMLRTGAVLHAKTGSLEHVDVLSGYLATSTGHHLIFSLMANNFTFPSRQAAAVLDEIVVEAERAAD